MTRTREPRPLFERQRRMRWPIVAVAFVIRGADERTDSRSLPAAT